MKAPPFWATHIGVPKLEEAAANIKKLGGKAHTEVIQIPEVGRIQMFMDPQGAAFYIIQPASSERRPEGAPEVGEASWHQLMMTRWQAAMKFYEAGFQLAALLNRWTWGLRAITLRCSTGRTDYLAA